MSAVKEIYQQFPHTFKHLDSTLFLVKAPSDAKRDALRRLVEGRRTAGLERVSAPLKGVEDELLPKPSHSTASKQNPGDHRSGQA